MNRNKIFSSGFSNPDTKSEYKHKDERRDVTVWHNQCLTCIHYAEFNADYGLCRNKTARFYLETIFEHFGCEMYEVDKIDVEELLSMLVECESVLSAIRPAYPDHSSKVFHLRLRDYLRKHKKAGHLLKVNM